MKKIIENIPSQFVKTKLPEVFTEEWSELNHAKCFSVKIKNNALNIVKIERTNISELKISNGILKGIDKGEWGGILSFIPTDKSKEEIDIKYGNIKFVFEFKNKIYFIENISNTLYDSKIGLIYELNKEDFTYKKIMKFDDGIEAFTILNKKLLIATESNFYIIFYVIKRFKKELVFKNTFWRSLYPNSMVATDDEHVYLGIRSGIVKLNLIYRRMEFYKYTK